MPLRARNQLVVDHLHIVRAAAASLASRLTHVARDDLLSAGSYALVRAADRFDDTLGVPFGAFARGRVDGALKDELRAMDWAPREVRSRAKEAAAARERLTGALRRQPTVAEVSHELGLPPKAVRDALAVADLRVLSLDADEVREVPWSGHLPEELAAAEERDAFLRRAVEALSERKRWIIRAVYFDERTVGEIASELGVSHAAVSQQRAEAVRMLRQALQVHDASTVAPDVGAANGPARARASSAGREAYLARVIAAEPRRRGRGDAPMNAVRGGTRTSPAPRA